MLPAIFFGHGNPMNALLDNEYTSVWAAIGRELPRPRAVLAVSAHWYIPESAVTAGEHPRTLHDFGGFPSALYEVQYPAPGSAELIERVQQLLAPLTVRPSTSWGLDHGVWSVLRHVFPAADVPVVQLSIDETQPPSWHYALGRQLAPLRDEGVLVIGSGNLVHNLHTYAWGSHGVDAFDWAVRFERTVRERLAARDHEPLIAYDNMGADAQLSAPTPEHYLPFLYVIAAQRDGDRVSYPVEGVDGGSVSMLAVRIG